MQPQKNSKRTKRRAVYARSLLPVEERSQLRERGIYSGFGPRAVSSRGKVRVHKGIDISAPKGADILAFNDGEVVFSGRDNAYGISIIVQQIDGRKARYAHMSQALAQKGEQITRGQHIGAVGRTGRTTGPHLHFELIEDEDNIDPSDHVWLGAELVRGPDDLNLDDSADISSFAAKTTKTTNQTFSRQ